MCYSSKFWNETAIKRCKAKEGSQCLDVIDLKVGKDTNLFWVRPDSIFVNDVA